MRRLLLSVIALIGLCGAVAFGNYTMTQGTGTTFGSVVVGGFHYVQMFICDLTTPGQCAAVSAAGAVKVDATLAAETTKVIGTVRNVGNAGAIFDGATAAAVPANALYLGMNVGGILTGLTGTANGVKTDGSAVTQPTSLTSTTLSAPNGDRTVAPTAITTAGTATLSINSAGSSTVQWTFSSFTTGTINFQLADATGAAFNNAQCWPVGAPNTLVSSITAANGSWFCPVGGAALARIVMTGGGGTATVSANASAGENKLPQIAAEQGPLPTQSQETSVGGVGLLAGTTGGASSHHLLVATASTNSTIVKAAAAGTIYDVDIVQTTTTLGDLRIYDSAAAPTCSSATGLIINLPIQSNAVSPGMVHPFGPAGRKFTNGLGYCFTGAVADNDNTNWGGTASGVAINIGYK